MADVESISIMKSALRTLTKQGFSTTPNVAGLQSSHEIRSNFNMYFLPTINVERTEVALFDNWQQNESSGSTERASFDQHLTEPGFSRPYIAQSELCATNRTKKAVTKTQRSNNKSARKINSKYSDAINVRDSKIQNIAEILKAPLNKQRSNYITNTTESILERTKRMLSKPHNKKANTKGYTSYRFMTAYKNFKRYNRFSKPYVIQNIKI